MFPMDGAHHFQELSQIGWASLNTRGKNRMFSDEDAHLFQGEVSHIGLGRTNGMYALDGAHLFQELSQVVIVKWKGSDQQCVQDDTARPDVCSRPVILLTLIDRHF
jgi:hypothetical protein